MVRSVIVLLVALISTPAVPAAPAPLGADRAIVVTAQHLASDVGAEVLRHGGNVVDAAVATAYALAVVFPAAGNLGGGGFMTLRFADGRATFIDFRETAPAAATATMFLDARGNVVPGRSTDTWLAVGVPGTVAGLELARERYGTEPRADLLAPAIALAREGFPIAPADATLLGLGAPLFAADPATAAIFLDRGRPFAVGARLAQPELAATLQAIADRGTAGFYEGPVAQAIVAASRAGGGLLTEADLAAYRARERAPLGCRYRGYDVIAPPPPSAGGVAICEILTILEGYDLAAMGFHSAAEVHVMAEAMRRAFHDREGLGDPDVVANDTRRLLDPAYAASLRQGIAPDAATPSAALAPVVPPPAREGRQTTQFSIADAEGNAVSMTFTLNSYFGIGRVAGTTGVFMNNEMDDFASKPGAENQFGIPGSDANTIAPGKRPISSMAPTILTKGGRLAMVVGSPGGSRIVTIVTEAIVNVVDHGMTVSDAIDAPRFHMQWIPDAIEVEPFALSADTRRILEGEGYRIKDHAPWGQAAAIVTDVIGAGGGDGNLALPFLAKTPRPYRLYGADDDRDPVGSAAGD